MLLRYPIIGCGCDVLEKYAMMGCGGYGFSQGFSLSDDLPSWLVLDLILVCGWYW
jgi:hypothetical protein